MNLEPISKLYHEAKRDLIGAEIELAALEGKASELRSQREESSKELARLLELEQADHISRVLDGERAAPKKPKRLTRIANLREEIAGIDASIPVHENRLKDARQRLEAAKQKIGEVVLPPIIEQKAQAFAACAAPLHDLLEALFDAAAFDVLQEQFAGSSGLKVTNLANQSGLFSAQIILDRFKKALPPRFVDLAAERISGSHEAITKKAKAIAEEIGI
jgi:Asp-tRNA(Asn)/Glu-tRNA(Gln) amidotransferase A subunit family amidase